MNTEPLMREKRESATFFAYKRVDNEWAFYLQKRDPNAVRAPGVFGMFGGGIEDGEEPVHALFREVKEELEYVPQNPVFFSRYETARSIFNVFIEEVGDDFESKVKVQEGEYGKFFTSPEIQTLSDISPGARMITFQLNQELRNGLAK
jgi:8-oxo-dGTP diphosphatase